MKNIGMYVLIIVAMSVYSGIVNNAKANNGCVTDDSVKIIKVVNVNGCTVFFPSNNKSRNVDGGTLPSLKNGDPAPDDVLLGRRLPLDIDKESAIYLANVVKLVLGDNHKYEGAHMYITLRILPETAEIADIIFEIPQGRELSLLYDITASEYLKMAELIRKNVKFIVNEVGKQLNFCLFWQTYQL